MKTLIQLLRTSLTSDRPRNMQNDDCLSGLTWADLEEALTEIASPANRRWVGAFTTGLWKESRFLPNGFNLTRVLTAAKLLAGPDCLPGHEEKLDSET